MRLRILTSIAGADCVLGPGDITERFNAQDAQRLISAGYAELVTEAPIERAVREPAPERRDGRKARHVVSSNH